MANWILENLPGIEWLVSILINPLAEDQLAKHRIRIRSDYAFDLLLDG